MTSTPVASLAAGVVGTEHYALYGNDDVFLIDALGQTHKVDESLAKKVREAIKRGQSPKPENPEVSPLPENPNKFESTPRDVLRRKEALKSRKSPR